MTSQEKTDPRKQQQEKRQKSLEKALRENLKRRKQPDNATGGKTAGE